ncbi:MAG: 6-phosphofructokinase [Faecalibacterium sp.]
MTDKNIVVGQSGGPTAVINASLAGVYETARSLGVQTVYGMRHGIEGLLSEELVNLNELLNDKMDIELLKRTPSSYLGSCRYKLPDPEVDTAPFKILLALFAKYEIGAVFYIGGNDSMDTIAKLSRYGAKVGSKIRFIGVPKTIDNDLCMTDHTPGFGSAAKYIATIMKELICDSEVYDLRSVTVAEIMGRNAGWLAGAACLAQGEDCKGPDVILLPEIPFDEAAFLAKVDALQKQQASVMIAVSEGVKTADGTYLCNLSLSSCQGATDAFGHTMLSGTSRYLADLISAKLGCKTRAIELSTLQRCASHLSSRTDITEAYAAGGAAAMAAHQGQSGQMIAFKRTSSIPYQCITEAVDVQAVANQEKEVPRDWISADGMNVNEKFALYARPLIQAELTPIYINGTPRHIRL